MGGLGQGGGLYLTLPDLFPGLRSCVWRITSPESDNYNCIAWAADDTSRWWEPTTPFHWPVEVPRKYTLTAYRMAFEALGYEVCGNRQLEPGYEKIAIYGLAGEPEHAAKQMPDGSWSSKLGYLNDIVHAKLEALEGADYGFVEVVMRRPLRKPE